jgi:pimeloyl-ACP methyl ester carboxylesterase
VFEPSQAWAPTWPKVLHDHLEHAIERARHKVEAAPERHRERVFIAEASLSLVRAYDLGELRVPCVLGVGGASSPVMVKAMDEMATAIGAERYEIPGAGHMAQRENPEAFADFVRRAVALAN